MNFFPLAILIVLFFSGCASVQHPGVAPAPHGDFAPITAYEFNGRIAAIQDEKGHYGNIRWVRRDSETDVVITSPVGQVVAKIHDAPSGATLTLADRRQFSAESSDELTKQVLGYVVPVKGLNYWLLGRTAPGEPLVEQQRGDTGLVEKIRQGGWRIRYSEYMEVAGVGLPRRMVLERDNLEIRLVVDEWMLHNAALNGNERTSLIKGADR